MLFKKYRIVGIMLPHGVYEDSISEKTFKKSIIELINRGIIIPDSDNDSFTLSDSIKHILQVIRDSKDTIVISDIKNDKTCLFFSDDYAVTISGDQSSYQQFRFEMDYKNNILNRILESDYLPKDNYGDEIIDHDIKDVTFEKTVIKIQSYAKKSDKQKMTISVGRYGFDDCIYVECDKGASLYRYTLDRLNRLIMEEE